MSLPLKLVAEVKYLCSTLLSKQTEVLPRPAKLDEPLGSDSQASERNCNPV